MVGKRSSKAKHQGLERTDNDLEFTSWPQVNPINQKNYYTEYLKRDDQALVFRLQNEENRNRMARAARDKDRALANANQNDVVPAAENNEVDGDENMITDDANGTTNETDQYGSKVIVIHPGSQNLRIGFATDALPKVVPMVIAHKSSESEFEEINTEPRPKRRKFEDDQPVEPNKMFGDDFAENFTAMCADLRARLKRKGRRLVPNSKEVAISYNRKTPPEIIPEHNDSHRIEWTEISTSPESPPEYITGHKALRIPDTSIPRYKLYWPLRYGFFNERDYANRNQMLRDFSLVIEEAIKDHLGLEKKNNMADYSCVFVIPDLYERTYVTTVLEMLFREFRFGRVCFIQESLSASFGAGYSTCVIVDVGAEKTSICCVDEGMCVENSRVTLKYGGEDITDTFIKMLLADHFPYSEINMKRRYDFVLAEELKHKFCTMLHDEVSVRLLEFFVRAFGQDTRHYNFKTYDETMLAPMCLFKPEMFDSTNKLKGRRKLLPRSYDLYDGSPNDPLSTAQAQVLADAPRFEPDSESEENGTAGNGSVDEQNSETNGQRDEHTLSTSRVSTNTLQPPLVSTAAAPVASTTNEDRETPQPARESTPAGGDKDNSGGQLHPLMEMIHSADVRDRSLPCTPLEKAIILSIEQAARGDERKMRDFFGGIIPIGGGCQFQGFNQFLEEELADAQPRFRKEVIVGQPPREIDPQVLVWKGASVLGKLRGATDTWISGMEYDRLGSRVLAYKCLWSW